MTVVDSLIGGMLAALGITMVSFVVAQRAAATVRRMGQIAVVESVIGTGVRVFLTGIGVLGVLVFDRSTGIYCALGAIPLYFVELVGSVVLLLSRLQRRNEGTEGSPSKLPTVRLKPDSESNQ